MPSPCTTRLTSIGFTEEEASNLINEALPHKNNIDEYINSIKSINDNRLKDIDNFINTKIVDIKGYNTFRQLVIERSFNRYDMNESKFKDAIVDVIYDIDNKIKGEYITNSIPILGWERGNKALFKLLKSSKDRQSSRQLLDALINNTSNDYSELAQNINKVNRQLKAKLINSGSSAATDNYPRIRFSREKLIKNKDNFINDLNIDNNIFDDILLKLTNSNNYFNPSNIDNYLSILSKYSDDSLIDTILININNDSKLYTMRSTLGDDYEKTIELVANESNLSINDKDIRTAINALIPKSDIIGANNLAKTAKSLRLATALSQLGSSLFTSFADLGVVLGHFKITFNESMFGASFRTFKALFSKIPDNEKNAVLGQYGAFVDGVLGDVYERVFGDSFTNKTLNRISNFFFTVNGLNAWTNNLKKGVLNQFSHIIGSYKDLSFNKLSNNFQYILRDNNINSKEWDIIRTTMINEDNYLIPDLNNNLSSKVYTMLYKEVNTSVLTPDLRSRQVTRGTSLEGTLQSELWRSMTQYLSFPIMFQEKYIKPLFMSTGGFSKRFNSAGDFASSVSTLFGSILIATALSNEIKKTIRGEKSLLFYDDRDMKDFDYLKYSVGLLDQSGLTTVLGSIFLEGVGAKMYSDGFTGLTDVNIFQTVDNLINIIKKGVTKKEVDWRAIKRSIPGNNIWFLNTFLNRAIEQNLLTPKQLRQIKASEKRRGVIRLDD